MVSRPILILFLALGALAGECLAADDAGDIPPEFVPDPTLYIQDSLPYVMPYTRAREGEFVGDEFMGESVDDEFTAPLEDCRDCPPEAEVEAEPLPPGFVYVASVIPDALLDIRYYSAYNFVGTRIDGYEGPAAILTREAAEALRTVADAARARGYVIKIFDAYRPHRATEHFRRWSKVASDTVNKAIFYPAEDKSLLFPLGYISEKTGHSRGSTIDLTLVDRNTGKDLDMGSGFDFLDPLSRHGAPSLTPTQTANRALLKTLMQNGGFKPYREEWWHYTLLNEPFPDTYFDFVVR